MSALPSLPLKPLRKPKALPPEARETSNTKPHTEATIAPEVRASLKGATARKARHGAMLACGCRLCALALNPPLTFAEWERLGLGAIGREYAAESAERAAASKAHADEQRAREIAERAEARKVSDEAAAAARASEAAYLRRRELERKLIEARRVNDRLTFKARCQGGV